MERNYKDNTSYYQFIKNSMFLISIISHIYIHF